MSDINSAIVDIFESLQILISVVDTDTVEAELTEMIRLCFEISAKQAHHNQTLAQKKLPKKIYSVCRGARIIEQKQAYIKLISAESSPLHVDYTS